MKIMEMLPTESLPGEKTPAPAANPPPSSRANTVELNTLETHQSPELQISTRNNLTEESSQSKLTRICISALAVTRATLPAIIPLLLLAGGLLLVHKLLQEYNYQDLQRAFDAILRHAFFAASAVCLINYMLLAGYDWLGLRTIGKSLPFSKISITSFISYSVSQTIGLPLLSSTAIRH